MNSLPLYWDSYKAFGTSTRKSRAFRTKACVKLLPPICRLLCSR